MYRAVLTLTLVDEGGEVITLSRSLDGLNPTVYDDFDGELHDKLDELIDGFDMREVEDAGKA